MKKYGIMLGILFLSGLLSGCGFLDDAQAGVPVITGTQTMDIEIGSSEPDWASKIEAYDLEDFQITITSSMIDATNVNLNELGTYQVIYTVEDSDGNTSTHTLTVNVVDTSVPTINLIGSLVYTIEVGDTFTDPGATAKDKDGNILEYTVNDTFDSTVIGTYTFEYVVVNSQVSVTRTVVVVDTTKPVIELNGYEYEYVQLNGTFTDLGTVVTDNYDSELVVTVTGVVDETIVGVYQLVYTTVDTSLNEAIEVIRNVVVFDGTYPIYVQEEMVYQTLENETLEIYTDFNASEYDVVYSDYRATMTINDTVDKDNIGVYNVIYSYRDSASVQQQTTIEVTVVDTTAPVITIGGSSEITLEVFDVYTEEGATAVDNYDETVLIITDSTSLDTSVTGIYYITYDVTDISGNVAIQVIRTVNVIDSTPPIFTLIGNDHLYVELGTSYIDPDFEETDNYSLENSTSQIVGTVVDLEGDYTVTYTLTDQYGNVSDSVVITVTVINQTLPYIYLDGEEDLTLEYPDTYNEIEGFIIFTHGKYDLVIIGYVDDTVLADYTLTYSYDDNGTIHSIDRVVHVVDTTPPVILLEGDSEITYEVFDTYNELGSTVTDNYDIENIVIIDSTNIDMSTVGTYYVYYDITDSNSNVAIQVVRTINVVDTTAPSLVLIGNEHLYVELDGTFIDPSFEQADNYSLDNSELVISGTVDNLEGDYTLIYTLKDQYGNASEQITIVVTVIDQTLPYIYLEGVEDLTLEYPNVYTELEGFIIFTHGKYDLVITGTVDDTILGDYTLTYTYDDNGTIYTIDRVIHIVDTTPPVITLIDNEEITIEVFGEYIEFDATITDNHDSDLVAVIDATDIDLSVVGTYYVYYDITDANSNIAVQVVRTIQVVDTTAPTLVLIGNDSLYVELGTTFIHPNFDEDDNYSLDFSTSQADGTVEDIVGEYTIIYTLTDQYGNVSDPITITVTVIDQTLPYIYLEGEVDVTLEYPNEYIELEGFIIFTHGKYDLTITGTVEDTVLGDYTLTYTYDDNGTIHTIDRVVHIVDTTPPVIVLIGDVELTYEVYDIYVEYESTVTDNYDEDLTVIIDASEVDLTTLGTYYVYYDITDVNGNVAVQVIRTVNVVDTTVPTINLLGEVEYVFNLNDEFIDLGIEYTDNYDLSPVVTVEGTVDMDTPGVYILTYYVTDQSGNKSIELTRTVEVLYETPTLTIDVESLTPNTIENSFTFLDPTLRINNITLELYLDDVLVQEMVIFENGLFTDLSGITNLELNISELEGLYSVEFELNLLNDDSNYKVKAVYSYQDITNTEVIIDLYEKDFKTMSSSLDLDIIQILEDAVFEGETFSTIITLNNSYLAEIDHITIDGVEYNDFLTGSSPGMLIFYIDTLDDLGSIIHTIEDMEVVYNGDTYYIDFEDVLLEVYVIKDFVIQDVRFNEMIVEITSHNLLTVIFDRDPLIKIVSVEVNGVVITIDQFTDVFVMDAYATYSDLYQEFTISKVIYEYDGNTFEYNVSHSTRFFSASTINYIDTVEDLLNMEADCSVASCSGVYILTADLDLTGFTFNGIGTSLYPFEGVFEGNHHTISNYIVSEIVNSSEVLDYALFNYTNNAIISNVIIDGFDLNVTNIKVDPVNIIYMASLIAHSTNTTIDNVYILNTELKVTNSNETYIGGLTSISDNEIVSNVFIDITIIKGTAEVSAGLINHTNTNSIYINVDVLSSSILDLFVTSSGQDLEIVNLFANSEDYVDHIKPLIELVGMADITLLLGQTYVEQGVIVIDNFDANPTVVIYGTVDIDTIGEYIITYEVTDASGNISLLQRRVSVSNEKTVIGDGLSVFDSIQIGTDIFIVGSFTSIEEYGLTSNGKTDGFIAAYDENFNLIWIVNIGGAEHEVIDKITYVGNYILVSGHTLSSVEYDLYGTTVKEASFITLLNIDGTVIWTKILDGDKVETIESITFGLNNEIYVGGNTTSTDGIFTSANQEYQKVFVFEYDITGQLINSLFIDDLGNDNLSDLKVDSAGLIYIITNNTTFDTVSKVTVTDMTTVFNTVVYDDIILEELFIKANGDFVLAGKQEQVGSVLPYYFAKVLDDGWVELVLYELPYYTDEIGDIYLSADGEVIVEVYNANDQQLYVIELNSDESTTEIDFNLDSVVDTTKIESKILVDVYDSEIVIYVGNFSYYNKISNEYVNGIYLRFD